VLRGNLDRLDAKLAKKRPVALRITTQPRPVPDQNRKGPVSLKRQTSRHHPGISAVLPRSSEEHDTPEAIAEDLAHGLGCATPGVFHQHQTRDAKLLHGRAIHIARLVACKKRLHHWIMP